MLHCTGIRHQGDTDRPNIWTSHYNMNIEQGHLCWTCLLRILTKDSTTHSQPHRLANICTHHNTRITTTSTIKASACIVTHHLSKKESLLLSSMKHTARGITRHIPTARAMITKNKKSMREKKTEAPSYPSCRIIPSYREQPMSTTETPRRVARAATPGERETRCGDKRETTSCEHIRRNFSIIRKKSIFFEGENWTNAKMPPMIGKPLPRQLLPSRKNPEDAVAAARRALVASKPLTRQPIHGSREN